MAHDLGFPKNCPTATMGPWVPAANVAHGGMLGQTATEVSAEPPLSLELSYVSNNLSELQMELDALERQLQPVMLPCAPDSPGKPDAPNATRGIVVDALSAFTSRLQSIRSQVVRLRGQLTV